MRYQYLLRVGGAESAEVARILGPSSRDTTHEWVLELNEGPTEPPTAFVDVFLGILQGKLGPLESIGISRDDVTIWVLCEYDEQCNLESGAQDLKRLGDLGISLCVSCWQAPS